MQEAKAADGSLDQDDEAPVSLFDVLMTLAKHRRRIALATFAGAGLAAVIAFTATDIYTASTRILPPQPAQSSASAMFAQLGAMGGAAGALAGLKNPNDLYIGMLRSRTLLDAMVKRFDLVKAFGAANATAARGMLMGASKIYAGKDGLIAVEVDHADPKFAALLANGYVEELHQLTQSLAVSEASQRRLFFERQLKNARDTLTGAELALKQLQEKSGVVMLSEQSRASVEAVANVRGQMAAKEIQIQSMRAFATSGHPDLKFAQQELESLRSQLAKIKNSEPGDAMLAPSKIPAEALEYVRRLREVRYAETIFEVLSRQYEVARIDEGRDASLIQVLDVAVPPEIRSGPKRRIIVVLGAVLAMVLAMISAFISEALEKARADARQSERWSQLKALFLPGRAR